MAGASARALPPRPFLAAAEGMKASSAGDSPRMSHSRTPPSPWPVTYTVAVAAFEIPGAEGLAFRFPRYFRMSKSTPASEILGCLATQERSAASVRPPAPGAREGTACAPVVSMVCADWKGSATCSGAILCGGKACERAGWTGGGAGACAGS